MEETVKSINEIYEKLNKLKQPFDIISQDKYPELVVEFQKIISICEKILSLDLLKAKDFSLMKKDFDILRKDLDNLILNTNTKINENSEKFDALNEKIQEISGEINQLRLHFKIMKSQMSEKENHKSEFVKNVMYPILVTVVLSLLFFVCNILYKTSIRDYNFDKQIEQMEHINSLDKLK